MILALVLAFVVAGCGHASPGSAEGLIIRQVASRAPGAMIAISSGAVGPDQGINRRNTGYGANLSPPVSWQPVAGAADYVLVIQDPDAQGPTPFVHWMIWNIPGGTRALGQGLPPAPVLAAPRGAIQGHNDTGGVGYFGPRPPAGTGLHHYHLQIFALDAPIQLGPDADLPALAGAMRGHVIAEGDLVGVFAAPSQP
jgi:Raf kinase inhibitor-like YbhB/YbcL family protein